MSKNDLNKFSGILLERVSGGETSKLPYVLIVFGFIAYVIILVTLL
jgi:hypothetical protein